MGKTHKPTWKTYRDIGIQELKLSKYLLFLNILNTLINPP